MSRERFELIDLAKGDGLEMPYTPAVRVTSGAVVYLAGVTAAPIYHSHPHVAEEFNGIPDEPSAQTDMTVDNLAAVLAAAGGGLTDIVEMTRYIVSIDANQDAVNRVLAARLGSHRPATTTVEVTRLATDPRLVLELTAVAVVAS